MPLEQILLAVLAAINILAFLVMVSDKRKSMASGNPDRIPEGVLFFLATAFGSIGIYTAMILLHHKTRKWYFQIGIPLLILQNIAILYSYIVIEPTTVTFVIDLVVAIVLGTLIGIEREARGKDAGISMNCFVIVGAMLFTFMSDTVDPASQSRIAAQVVTGIGFLGAGLILKDGTSVRNLTTAASLWFSGAIGMSIGFGYLQIAIIAALAAILIPRIPHVKHIGGKGKNALASEKTMVDDGPEKASQMAGASGGD